MQNKIIKYMLVAWETFNYYTKETFVSKKGEKALELLPMTPLCRHRLIVNIIIIIMARDPL